MDHLRAEDMQAERVLARVTDAHRRICQQVNGFQLHAVLSSVPGFDGKGNANGTEVRLAWLRYLENVGQVRREAERLGDLLSKNQEEATATMEAAARLLETRERRGIREENLRTVAAAIEWMETCGNVNLVGSSVRLFRKDRRRVRQKDEDCPFWMLLALALCRMSQTLFRHRPPHPVYGRRRSASKGLSSGSAYSV
jgi:hypothetical protein